MALIFCDSFAHYATAQINLKWNSSNSAAIVGSTGRRSNNSLRIYKEDSFALKTLDSGYSTLYFGVAWKPGSIISANSESYPYLQFLEGSTEHISIRHENGQTGRLIVSRAGTKLGTSSGSVMRAGIWTYIEVKIYIHDSAGTVDIKANGASILSLSGIDTKNGGTGVINGFKLFGDYDQGYNYFNDLWVSDTDWLGDCKVECLYPSGAGDTTEWTPSTGSNYACVDEATPDVADYVSSSTLNQVDTYAFGDLSTTGGSIKGVQANIYASKDDSGGRSIAAVARPGSTDQVGGSKALTTSALYYMQIWSLNPDTAAAWAISEVNASKFGIKLVA